MRAYHRLRTFAQKTEVVSSNGGHVRFVPGPMASTMVKSGAAEIHNANGKVKSIRLVASAATHLIRIGEPTADGWLAPRYCVREKLDSGHVLWKHHPRCIYK